MARFFLLFFYYYFFWGLFFFFTGLHVKAIIFDSSSIWTDCIYLVFEHYSLKGQSLFVFSLFSVVQINLYLFFLFDLSSVRGWRHHDSRLWWGGWGGFQLSSGSSNGWHKEEALRRRNWRDLHQAPTDRPIGSRQQWRRWHNRSGLTPLPFSWGTANSLTARNFDSRQTVGLNKTPPSWRTVYNPGFSFNSFPPKCVCAFVLPPLSDMML